jgi:hypothetical protein
MSLNGVLQEAIEKVIQTFITKVSTTYNLDNNDLNAIWTGNIYSEKLNKDVCSPDISNESLLKCNKDELKALCKQKGYKCSGSKPDLISRLLGKEDTKQSDTKKSDTKKSDTKKEISIVEKKLIANIPNILIKRNKYNNYEHPETSFVFNNETKIVIGKQNKNGSIEELTEDDIDKCNAFKFQFQIPMNLDKKSKLVDVKVEELDEDEDEDEELEVEEEELEELVEEDDLEEDDLEEDDLEEDDLEEDDLEIEEEY